MHIVQLKLNTTAQDVRSLNKRFYEMNHIHNVIVKHGMTQLNALKDDTEYNELLKSRKTAPKSKKKEINKQLSEIRLQYGLSESQLQSYAKLCGKQFSKRLSSQQIQKEATRVWQGVNKCLFSSGRHLHFKRCEEMTTIQGKTNINGVRFDKETLAIDWQGLHISCKQPKHQKDIWYLEETLNHSIKYCEIARKCLITDGTTM